MRLATIAIVFVVTFAAAPSASSTVLAQDPNHVASVAAPSERSASLASDALPVNGAWYRDPVSITLAIVGLFVLIDMSFLLTEHRQRLRRSNRTAPALGLHARLTRKPAAKSLAVPSTIAAKL